MIPNTFTAGIFEATQIGLGQRWQVTNKVTDVSHVTYGTYEEVRDQLEATTKAWERKNVKYPRGNGAWRARQTAEVRVTRKESETGKKLAYRGV